MTLSVFTTNDRRRLQHYLNLPVQAVAEGSSLYRALVFVEDLDSQEGTDIADSVKSRLDALETLESVDTRTGAFIDAAQSENSQLKSISIPSQYSKAFGETSKSGLSGEASALDQQKERLISAIKRDLGLKQQPGSNQLNTVWPGGQQEARRVGVEYSYWRNY